MMKANMYLQIDNGNGGLLISDENSKWYYFDASEIPYSIIYPESAFAADNKKDQIEAMISSIRNAIKTGDLYSAEEFVYEYENNNLHIIKEYTGLTLDDIDNMENYETTYSGDKVPKNHDITSWYKI